MITKIILLLLTALILILQLKINWEAVSAISAFIASIVSLYISARTIRKVDEQLSIEQEPYVVLLDGISLDKEGEHFALRAKLKNIGRGPAINVVLNTSEISSEMPLLEANEPHSQNLGSGDTSEYLRIENGNFEAYLKQQFDMSLSTAVENGKPLYLYIHCSEQLLKRKHLTEIKLIFTTSRAKPFFKVMEHKKKVLERK